jgi:hypothetical protein
MPASAHKIIVLGGKMTSQKRVLPVNKTGGRVHNRQNLQKAKPAR